MHSIKQQLHIVGVNSCLGAQDKGCSTGPLAARNFGIEAIFEERYIPHWHSISHKKPSQTSKNTSDLVFDVCEQLADKSQAITANNSRLLVLGGDHSCAIGTWSGIKRNYTNEEIGLIWIDAHMDSHLPETSPSKAIHGMPLACLLGHGEDRFRELAGCQPVVQPKNVCLIGIRSYEPEEKALLDVLGVRVFHMKDVEQHGLAAVFKMAVEQVTRATEKFGISIDLDAIDPNYAPGVGSPEENGLNPSELIESLTGLKGDDRLLGLEIAELNPNHDINQKTTQLCIDLAKAVF